MFVVTKRTNCQEYNQAPEKKKKKRLGSIARPWRGYSTNSLSPMNVKLGVSGLLVSLSSEKQVADANDWLFSA